jgi:hypothetical protein
MGWLVHQSHSGQLISTGGYSQVATGKTSPVKVISTYPDFISTTGGMSMETFQSRRSCRVALSVPIRVMGVDDRGNDFTEEAQTIIVNLHGAMIRMSHEVLPDSEIRLLSHPTGQDSHFRVVSKMQNGDLKFTYWGVENKDPGRNIWGVELPERRPGVQIKVAVRLQCPTCSARDSFYADAILLASLHEKGGMERACDACKTVGLWKLLDFPGVRKAPD